MTAPNPMDDAQLNQVWARLDLVMDPELDEPVSQANCLKLRAAPGVPGDMGTWHTGCFYMGYQQQL